MRHARRLHRSRLQRNKNTLHKPHILGHVTLCIDRYLVHSPQLLSSIDCCPQQRCKWGPDKTKIDIYSNFSYERVWELAAGSLTDVGIMVMTKSCLYQTQHSGLTMTANGHICHSTKMGPVLARAASVECVFVQCAEWEAESTEPKSQLVLPGGLKVFLLLFF